MKKFFILLKKEVVELLTPQTILSIVLMLAIFYFLGMVMKGETKKVESLSSVGFYNEAQNNAAASLADFLNAQKAIVDFTGEGSIDKALAAVKSRDLSGLIVLRQGFGENAARGEAENIDVYTVLKSFSITASINSVPLDRVRQLVSGYLSSSYLSSKAPNVNPATALNPVTVTDHLVIGDKSAEANMGQIISFIMSQTMFIPIILMMAIIFSAQMVLTSVASEKENKTLETLLTLPISRTALVIAKIMAAGLVALLMAGIYMIGFQSYMQGIMSSTGASLSQTDSGITPVLEKLGLVLTPGRTCFSASRSSSASCARFRSASL